jgi:hypothetical protein
MTITANHRLLNIEVSYEISLKSPRMTAEGLRMLRLLGCLPEGVAHGELDAIYPGCGHKAAGDMRQIGLALDEAGRLRVLAPLRESRSFQESCVAVAFVSPGCSPACQGRSRIGQSGQDEHPQPQQPRKHIC